MSENRKRPAATSNDRKMNTKDGNDFRDNDNSISSTTGNGDANKRVREISNSGRRVSGNLVLGERNEELGVVGQDIQGSGNQADFFPRDSLEQGTSQQYAQNTSQEYAHNLTHVVHNDPPPSSMFPGSSQHSNALDLSSGPYHYHHHQQQQGSGSFPLQYQYPESLGSSILHKILNEKPNRPDVPSVKKFFSRLPIPQNPNQPVVPVRPLQNHLGNRAPLLHHPSFPDDVAAAGFIPSAQPTPPSQPLALQPPSSASVFPTPAGVSVDMIGITIGHQVPDDAGHQKVNDWLKGEVDVTPNTGRTFDQRRPMEAQLTRFESTFSVSVSPARVFYLNQRPGGVSQENWLNIIRIVMDKVLDVNLTVYSSSEMPTNELTFWNPFYRFDTLFRVAKCLAGGANTANLLQIATAQSLLTLETSYHAPEPEMIQDTKGIIRVLGDKSWSNFVIQILNVLYPERRNPDSPEHSGPSKSLAIHSHLFSLFNPLALSLPSIGSTSSHYQSTQRQGNVVEENPIDFGRIPETAPPNAQPYFHRGPET